MADTTDLKSVEEIHTGSNPVMGTKLSPKGEIIMEKNIIVVFGGKVYGEQVSQYGLENGYLDYLTLSKIVGPTIMNNYLRAETMEDWEIVAGDLGESEIYQDYIISEYGYEFLANYTDELVFYNERLHIYVWGISHFGTGWDYVLTNIKLVEGLI